MSSFSLKGVARISRGLWEYGVVLCPSDFYLWFLGWISIDLRVVGWISMVLLGYLAETIFYSDLVSLEIFGVLFSEGSWNHVDLTIDLRRFAFALSHQTRSHQKKCISISGF